ncbi:ATP-dependent DNA helicase yku80 [Savitreella phatthalungensis]
MADKSCTVFVVDTSAYMAQPIPSRPVGNWLDWVREYLGVALGRKVMAARKTDFVAVVAVGSDITDNEMIGDDDYNNIRVIIGFPDPDDKDARTSYTFDRTKFEYILTELYVAQTSAGDLMSAIIVGIQLISKFCKSYKFRKDLVVITSGETGSDFTIGTQIAARVLELGIQLLVLGIGFADPSCDAGEGDGSKDRLATETALKQLVDDTSGIFATFAEAAKSMHVPRIKPVRPVPLYRGPLTVGMGEKAIAIDVEVYAKTKLAKPPSATKVSTLINSSDFIDTADAPTDRPKNSRPVNLARSYRTDSGREVDDRGQLERGFTYGRTVVPVSEADAAFLRFATEPCLELLGCFEAQDYRRYFSMSESYEVAPKRNNAVARLAHTALAMALYDVDYVAVMRYVKKGDAPPQLMLLSPAIEPGKVALYMVQLPFADDVRNYRFAPLDRIRTVRGDITESHRYLPSSALSDAMDAYVEAVSLDKSTTDGTEDLLPLGDSFSHGVHSINHAITRRALGLAEVADAAAAAVLLTHSRPLPSVMKKATTMKAVGALTDTAVIKRVPAKLIRKRRRDAEDEPAADDADIDLDDLLHHGKAVESKRSSEEAKMDEHQLSHNDPVRKFEEMMSDDNLVDRALMQIQPVIKDIVQFGTGDRDIDVAIEALQSFRRHALEQEETELFNEFLQDLDHACRCDWNRGQFADQLKDAGITKLSS